MKDEKFKVLLYLKKSTTDKKGKAPIMGRITLGNSMSQFCARFPAPLTCGIPVKAVLTARARRRLR